MQLRPYQQAAVDAVYNHLRDRDDNPCVVIPTAGGKTPCMATICKDAVTLWQGRVLVLAHVKELLQQTADKLTAVRVREATYVTA
jgi:DNA repair protein RadD